MSDNDTTGEIPPVIINCKPIVGTVKCCINDCEDVEFLRNAVMVLWGIVDDIDTYGDMTKDDNNLFRKLVERKQKERWKLSIACDGFDIFQK